jgi:hypothetical protein
VGQLRDSQYLFVAFRSGRERSGFGLLARELLNHATPDSPENRGVAGSIPALAMERPSRAPRRGSSGGLEPAPSAAALRRRYAARLLA